MTTDKPRRRLSALERAKEALGVADRKVDRLTAKRAALQLKKAHLRDEWETRAAEIDSDVSVIDYDLDDLTRERDAFARLVADLTPQAGLSGEDGAS